MKITVNLDRDIHPIAQMILIFLREQKFDLIKEYFPLSAYKHVLELKEKGYIISDVKPDTPEYMYVLSGKKVKQLLGESSSSEEWIQEYRDLFKGKGRDGIMGSKSACIKKMDKFLNAHPYTKEHILEATRKYIRSVHPQYQYLKQADYFISKEQGGVAGSGLEAFCEQLALQETNQIPDDTWNMEDM